MIMDFFAFFDLSYRQWDAIADSYIPLLVLLNVMHLVLYVLHGTHCFKAFIFQYLKQSSIHIACILLCLIWVYGLMFIDNALKIWPAFSYDGHILDYSTHTALAWVFSCYLFFVYQQRFKLVSVLLLITMGLYLCLMKFQNYHTFADMLTTSLVVLPPMVFVFKTVTGRTIKTL